jgi:hypothetical protein
MILRLDAVSEAGRNCAEIGTAGARTVLRGGSGERAKDRVSARVALSDIE